VIRTCLLRAAATIALVVGAPSARAVDGVIEVNQAKALAGAINGDLAADPAGFPVRITEPGSYRLTSHLTATDATTAAIQVNVSATGSVEIDLNGFSILGPNTCDGVPPTCSHPQSLQYGISALNTASSLLVIRNGTIRGVAGSAIYVNRPKTLIERVRIEDSGGNGIHCILDTCRVVDSMLVQNRLRGLDCEAFGCEVRGTEAQANGSDGIWVLGYAQVRGCYATSNNGDGIHAATGALVEGNTSSLNLANAIVVGADSLVLHNIVQGTVVGGTRVENVCNPACP
jgi:hypothetical protein